MGLIEPLCIIQARYNSTRLAGKMLLKLGDDTLIKWAVRRARLGFADNVVVAIPAKDSDGLLGDELRRIGAKVFAYRGPETDVLGRFWECAHLYRWHPDSVIVRWTPDDPFKDLVAVMRVVDGERLPVEQGAEAFTLAMLDAAQASTPFDSPHREHITHAIFPTPPPRPPVGEVWTIDTQADYEAACKRYGA